MYGFFHYHVHVNIVYQVPIAIVLTTAFHLTMLCQLVKTALYNAAYQWGPSNKLSI